MIRRLLNKLKHKKEWKKLYGDKIKKIKNKYKKDGIYHDKIEKTKQYRACADEVDKLAENEALKICDRGIGFCHVFWGCKKKILKEKYNLDWRSPAEMNPYCKFD